MWRKFPSIIKLTLWPPVSAKGLLAFSRWITTSSRAAELLNDERQAIEKMLSMLQGGYHFMVSGSTVTPPLVENSRHSHNFQLGSFQDNNCQLKVNFDELPLPSDIIDGALMHHVLEYSESAHRVLHEATRVLSPGGYLLVITFNPFSLYGLFGLFMRLFSKNPIWQRHALRKRRLFDWLQLLHMQPEAYCTTGYFLPDKWTQHRLVSAMLRNIVFPFGACQVVLAKKVVGRAISPGKVAWSVLRVRDSTPVKSSTHKKGKSIESS